MKKHFLAAAIAAVCLASCQTAAEMQAAEDRNMRKIIGWSMADFISSTGMMPATFYNTNPGRVYVVYGRSVTLVTPGSYGAPTVANSMTCTIMLTTKAIAMADSPASWQITNVNSRGPCANAY